jgi:phosphoribosylaminoimidazolecarboxamide formyltransferase/IMP cyclohydrolase
MKKKALISTTNKIGVVEFARQLLDRGFEMVSTGGTAKALRDAGIPVTDVAELTHFPEMLEGRLKTLHPLIHGGLLGDVRLPHHVEEMNAASIEPFQVVCVNLYEFEKAISGEHELAHAIESIDIGGPTMIRAAAKNYPNLYVVVEPEDYPRVISALDEDDSQLKMHLAAKAFRHTAYYDAQISRYLTQAVGEELFDAETLTFGFRRKSDFRHAENPHQRGALFVDPIVNGGIAKDTTIGTTLTAPLKLWEICRPFHARLPSTVIRVAQLLENRLPKPFDWRKRPIQFPHSEASSPLTAFSMKMPQKQWPKRAINLT